MKGKYPPKIPSESNYGISYSVFPDSKKKKKNPTFGKGDEINLSQIRFNINSIDGQISDQVGVLRQKLFREPTESEVRNEPKIRSLLGVRESLIGRYQQIISQHKFHNSQIQMMKATDPVSESKKSFAGIKRVNPFNEFKRKPIAVPALTPQHRLMKDSKKLGTLWDPRFSLSDVSVNPKVKHFYKRYIRHAK
jgi:hypothetical protein